MCYLASYLTTASYLPATSQEIVCYLTYKLSHWVPHLFGLVLNRSKDLRKLLPHLQTVCYLATNYVLPHYKLCYLNTNLANNCVKNTTHFMLPHYELCATFNKLCATSLQTVSYLATDCVLLHYKL